MPFPPLTDCRGLTVTAPAVAAVVAFDGLLDDLYAYRTGVGDRLDALVEQWPDFPLARILKGYTLMGEGLLDTVPAARAQADAAAVLERNRRESLHLEALNAWIAGDLSARTAAWNQLLQQWPLDLLAFRQLTGALFWSGEKRRQADLTLALVETWVPATPGYRHFLSMHAFSLQEVGAYAPAENFARQVLDKHPQDLWALHALAHVLEMQQRFAEGVDLLGDVGRFLDDYALFRGHLWWHLALFQVSCGAFDRALALFDHHVYPQTSRFYLDVQNGASLLLRLECQGVDVGDRWERLALVALDCAHRTTLWFTSAHFALALARTGQADAAGPLLALTRSAAATSTQAALASDVCEAMLHYASGNPRSALERLWPLRLRLNELGASHAQQDLYDQVMLTAALQCGEWTRLRQGLKARLAKRQSPVLNWADNLERAGRLDLIASADAVRAELRWETADPLA